MRKVWWIRTGAAVLAIVIAGCDSGRLMPEDMESMMSSEGGRWALQAIEGHGGIWRWRQRHFARFDYSELEVARGMDTVVTNRRRDTTISPRLDTLLNTREHQVFDLDSGRAVAHSASQNPFVQKGFDGRMAWLAQDGARVTDTAAVMSVEQHLALSRYWFSLPFSLLDTTLRFQVLRTEPAVDTVLAKGKQPGTYDTTLTDYNMVQLRVDYPAGAAPVPWLVLYLDDRDGQIRGSLVPAADSAAPARLAHWSDLQESAGLLVGGRRVSYPASPDGEVVGAFTRDRRYYNVDFPRELEEEIQFVWQEPVVTDSMAATDSSVAVETGTTGN